MVMNNWSLIYFSIAICTHNIIYGHLQFDFFTCVNWMGRYRRLLKMSHQQNLQKYTQKIGVQFLFQPFYMHTHWLEDIYQQTLVNQRYHLYNLQYQNHIAGQFRNSVITLFHQKRDFSSVAILSFFSHVARHNRRRLYMTLSPSRQFPPSCETD